MKNIKSIIHILNLTIIKEYYRQNAVFIFAIMLFSFGFLQANEHITIIKMALKLHSLLALAFIVWALHALKVILFTLRMLESKQNEFLYHIRLFSPVKQALAFAYMQFLLIQLTFLYSLWMIKIGIEEQRYAIVVAIVGYNILLILIGTFIYQYRIKHPNTSSVSAKPIQNFLARFKTPQYLFFIRYLFSKQPVLLLLTKLFSCFVLIGVCNLYPTDDYDERLLALGGLFSALGHTVFCQQFLYFEHKFLSISRNLPISHKNRILSYTISYFLILLPETIVLLRNFPEGVNYVFVFILILFILSLIFLNHHLQYINSISADTFGKGIFAAGILFLLLIMFKIPLILMVLVNFSIAIFVFQRNYYVYEQNTTNP